MGIKYKQVVPWGRNSSEYRRMFALSNDDLKLKILGCGDGPASFNYEWTLQGGTITSIDPVYTMTRAQLKERIDLTYDDIMTQTRLNQDKFIWTSISSVKMLGRIRMAAMESFLADYDVGKKQGRYIPATLPHLPFAFNRFDLALSSHFLFLYSANLSYEFHLSAIREMMRVAREVRIFPIIDVNSTQSPYIVQLPNDLQEFTFELKKVDYEFQKGGDTMMVVKYCNKK